MTLRRFASLKANETLASCFSRTAASNGIRNAHEFASHFEIDFGGIVTGEAHEVSKYASLIGLPVQALETAKVRIEGKTLTISGEAFSVRHADAMRLRCCPRCVLDDQRSEHFNTIHSYGRSEWLIKFLRTCPVHEIPLAQFHNSIRIASDFSSQLRSALKRVMAINAASQRSTLSPTESYLMRRLRKEKTNATWLDSMPVQTAIHFTELLGAVLKDGIWTDVHSYSIDDWIECSSAGFAVTSLGEAATARTLASIVEGYRGRKTSSLITFGMLASELLEESRHPGYEALLKMLESAERRAAN